MISQAMLGEVAPNLKTRVYMNPETVHAESREGDMGMQLAEIATANPEARSAAICSSIRSRPNTNVVFRARERS